MSAPDRIEFTEREKRLLRADRDPWLEAMIDADRARDFAEMDAYYAQLAQELEEVRKAHRDLDTVDAGPLAPSQDAQRAFDDDWRRATE